MISNLLDESILLREFRRFKNQRRWKWLLVCCVVCGFYAVPLLLDFQSAASTSANSLREHFSTVIEALTVCSSLLAFYQSMQVLRFEVATQTLNDLFVTLQDSRAVVYSMIVSGVAVSVLLLVVFMPFGVLCSTVLSVPILQFVMCLIIMLSSVLLSSALGAFWFFASQTSEPTTTLRMEAVLRLVWCGLMLAAVARAAGFHLGGTGPAPAILWTLVSGALFCSLRSAFSSIMRELTQLRISRERVSWVNRLVFWKQARVEIFIRLLALAGASYALLMLPQSSLQPEGGIFGPMSRVALAFPPVAAAATITSSASLQASSILCPFGVSLLLLVLFAGVTAGCLERYRRLRAAPETIGIPARREILAIDVGGEWWQGFANPILTREIRARFRSGDARIFLLLAALVTVLGGIAALWDGGLAFHDPVLLAQHASCSFWVVCGIQLAIVCLMGPGIGAEVITGERERKTLDMLRVTCLSPSEILRGRAQGVFGMLLVLVSPAIPLFALATLLHGVKAEVAFLAVGALLYHLLLLSCLCVTLSAICRSSVIAKVIGYIVCGAATYLLVFCGLARVGDGDVCLLVTFMAAASLFGLMVIPFWLLGRRRLLLGP